MRGKQSGGSQPERSNFRVLYIDGDLAAGEIQNMTNALIAAIRPTHVTMRGTPPRQLVAKTSTVAEGNGAGQEELGLEDTDVTEITGAELAEETSPKAKAPRARRTFRTPTPVEADMSGNGHPWEDFASEKNPDSHPLKYLVAAAWFHKYGSHPTIGVGHVYTCYKLAGWTYDVTDPGWPFRQLKADRQGDTNRGNFTINHLGLSKVEKMNEK